MQHWNPADYSGSSMLLVTAQAYRPCSQPRYIQFSQRMKQSFLWSLVTSSVPSKLWTSPGGGDVAKMAARGSSPPTMWRPSKDRSTSKETAIQTDMYKHIFHTNVHIPSGTGNFIAVACVALWLCSSDNNSTTVICLEPYKMFFFQKVKQKSQQPKSIRVSEKRKTCCKENEENTPSFLLH